MGVRARCNKRNCQARRTLSKPISQYVNRPKCHIPGCTGLMYEDKFRNGKREREIQPLCKCLGLPTQNRDGNAPHMRGTVRCVHRDEHLLTMSFEKGTKKHSPLKVHELRAIERSDDDEPGF